MMDRTQPNELRAAKRSIMRVTPQRSTGPVRRNRITLSCAPCRKRKAKCDRSKPCSQCVRLNQKDSCVYSPSSPSRSAPTPATSIPSRPVRFVPTTTRPSIKINAPPPFNSTNYGANIGSNADGHVAARDISHLSSPTGVRETPQQVPGISRALSDDDDNHDEHQAPSRPANSFNQSLAPLSFRGKQQRTRFFGRSHWATTLGMVRHRQPLHLYCLD